MPASHVDDRLARRNTLILSVAQALYGINSSGIVIVGGLVGHMLADDKTLATLPVTAMVLGSALSTVPVSLLMQRFGRRTGFVGGAILGLASALLAVHAIYQQDFWLFCLATHLTGYYQASAQYYRFAAADTASAQFRPKAISWVLAGGLAAAILGPQMVIWTRDLLSPALFAGCFVGSAVVATLAIATLSFVQIPKPRPLTAADNARPLFEILKQPRLLAAISAGMASYGMMSLVMTATPLAMIACNHTIDAAAGAITFHVIAMFAPSFFTGNLIARYGAQKIVLIGLVLLAACSVVALTGVSMMQFTLAMILLGLGWNFGFIGATSMVTDCHTSQERGKVQAVNDLCVFGFVAFSSFMSGKLLEGVGWEGVNYTLFPVVLLAAVLVILLPRLDRTRAVSGHASAL